MQSECWKVHQQIYHIEVALQIVIVVLLTRPRMSALMLNLLSRWPKRSFASSFVTKAKLSNNASSNHDEFSAELERIAQRQRERQEKADQEDEIRDSILIASLRHVPQMGWSNQAIRQGSKDLGYSGASQGMFEAGGVDLLKFHCSSSIEHLEVQLKKGMPKPPKPEGKESKEVTKDISEVLKLGIEARLKMNLPFMPKRWTEAMALMTLPQNAPTFIALDAQLIDSIWHCAGDEACSTDWYTKRLALGAVYKATEVFMIQDESKDYMDTWAFLQRRLLDQNSIQGLMEDVKNMPKLINNLATMATVLSGVHSRS